MHWFYDNSITESSEAISKDELKHVRSLRIRVGEQIAITDGRGSVYFCEMLDPASGVVKIVSKEIRSRLGPRIHVVQSLAKGDRDELALQMAVELGAASVTPLQAEHSIVSWEGKAERNQNRWQEIAISALKQSQQTHLVEVRPLANSQDLKPNGLGILLDPQAKLQISDLPKQTAELTLVAGPEGGFSQREIERFLEQGFVGYRLGDSILRTSSAAPAAMAAIFALTGRW
jgi:16S rRNA (uracil1498-N3)-methyltransferase